MESVPVLERCRNGDVIRRAGIDMYAGLSPDERPDQGKSPRPFMTYLELAEFVVTNEIPDSFVLFLMAAHADFEARG